MTGSSSGQSALPLVAAVEFRCANGAGKTAVNEKAYCYWQRRVYETATTLSKRKCFALASSAAIRTQSSPQSGQRWGSGSAEKA
jgi:hypothetical protein